MARFELTLSHGEKVVVDHPAADMAELLVELEKHTFVLFSEVKGVAAARDIIVSNAQLALIRRVEGDTRQSSSFVPKR